jgi:hypothetical protein
MEQLAAPDTLTLIADRIWWLSISVIIAGFLAS